MERMDVEFFIFVSVAVLLVLYVNYLLPAFLNIEPVQKEKYCLTDSDCSCGVKIGTDECFYGNKEFVDSTKQCPDFCNGIAANLVIICENNACIHTRWNK
ncbi:MAG: hypothetical protein V1678_01360 [Candidatus Aenigmatarchaeota archaeon]